MSMVALARSRPARDGLALRRHSGEAAGFSFSRAGRWIGWLGGWNGMECLFSDRLTTLLVILATPIVLAWFWIAARVFPAVTQ